MKNLHPKMVAAGVGGSVSVILLWLLGIYFTIPEAPAAAITALVSAGCAWVAPHLPGEKVDA